MRLDFGKLLKAMQPGRPYIAQELAKHFGTSTAHVNDMLYTLAKDGLVRISIHSWRVVRFERLPPHDMETPTSVAMPLVTRQMQGSMRGYEASLASVRSLAMLTRRRY